MLDICVSLDGIADAISHITHDVISVTEVVYNLFPPVNYRYIVAFLAQDRGQCLANFSAAHYDNLHFLPPRIPYNNRFIGTITPLQADFQW